MISRKIEQNAKAEKKKQQAHQTTRNPKRRVESKRGSCKCAKAATLKIKKLRGVGGMAQRLPPGAIYNCISNWKSTWQIGHLLKTNIFTILRHPYRFSCLAKWVPRGSPCCWASDFQRLSPRGYCQHHWLDPGEPPPQLLGIKRGSWEYPRSIIDKDDKGTLKCLGRYTIGGYEKMVYQMNEPTLLQITPWQAFSRR